MSDSVLQNCPDCGRLLYFSHAETTLSQCSCGSTIYRHNGLVSAKPFYALAQPVGFKQPGTEGGWNGREFTVLGRLRAWIEEFVFNQWTIRFDDGSLTYLGEGYGMYAIYEKAFTDSSIKVSNLETVRIGVGRQLFKDDLFLLERKYHCYKWELEGEAWWPFPYQEFQLFEFAETGGQKSRSDAVR